MTRAAAPAKPRSRSSTLTFLFTDVEGSTRLLEHLGEARYGEAVSRHARLLRTAFGRGGGREVDNQGDSFFFVFGDPARAALAAVDAQRALSAERFPDGSCLRVRMGLHTGRASVLDGKFVGLAVHRAARVGDAGHGGQIVVSETTAGILRDTGAFRLRDLGDHRLKDFERPLRLYQLVAEGLEPDFPPLRALSSGRVAATTGGPAGALAFVGRERELSILRHALQDVLSGSGRIALLQGEAGIGESRLAFELGHIAAEQGVATVLGSCVEGSAAPTLWPWLAVLREVGDLGGPETRATSPLVEGLLAPPSASGPAATGADTRFALYAAVAELLTSAARCRPLLIVLDDIQWADTPSLELLQTFALELVAAPVFFVATYREHEPDSPAELAHTLATIVRFPWTRRVVLRGLPEAAVAELIGQAAALEPPPALVAAVHSRTGGNPFFVAELMRLLAAEPGLGLDALSTGIPLGVRDVVRRRLESLPSETQGLLQLAAVIGDAFDFGLLASASGGDAAACAECLEQALASRTVVEAEEKEDLRFSHGLIRETIAADLTSLRRARLHACVAAALLADGVESVDAAEVVAEHVWHARQLVEPERAVTVLERAAGVALARHAYDSAERLLERALALVPRLPTSEANDAELRLELAIASLRMMTRGYTQPAVLAGFERAAAIARRAGKLRELVRSLHGTASGLGVGGRFRDSLHVAEACLAAATELDDPLALALAHHIVGIAHLHLGDIADARREFATCIEWYDRSRVEPAEAFDVAAPVRLAGPVFAAIAEELGGDTEAAAVFRERAITVADELDTPFARQVAMFFSGWLAALEDDPPACRAYIERGQEVVGEHVFPVFAAVSPPLSAWAVGRLGDRQAVDRLDAILGQLDAMGVKVFAHFFHGLRADLVDSRGDPEAALTAFEQAIAVCEAGEERFYLAELRRRRGELLIRVGRHDEGRAELRDALQLAREQRAGGLERRVLLTLADHCDGDLLENPAGIASPAHETEREA